jgi:hypothetical protein
MIRDEVRSKRLSLQVQLKEGHHKLQLEDSRPPLDLSDNG